MSNAVSRSILLLVGANLLAAFSDVTLKVLNGEVPTFEYVFIRQLIGTGLLFPFWWKLPKEQRQEGLSWITFSRAQLILLGSACAMIAVTYLPLATANAMFYVAPLLMLPLAFLLLKEHPTLKQILATAAGFAGVLIVLRPEQFQWAAIAGLGCALSNALCNLLIRRLPAQQALVSTLFWTGLMTLPISLLLALPQWEPIRWANLGWIVLINLLVLGYHALVVMAYRPVEANRIALAEYSGLVFATILGFVLFAEMPDLLTCIGIVLIVIPMMPIQWRKWLFRAQTSLAQDPAK
ncbi:DMT family transporter [Vibrio porteresiae]|uniref:DMT family transporter n=1 Tax=Vibrio porteresiae DSM 19223 TaxID=1123496 RepID=A0ABZ0QJ33_9VIBR|nr:DMT family transporter [Vibrio porteresiae]WPC76514.1 DMT family transporter [Vibrio porteresiae DSM 19223]